MDLEDTLSRIENEEVDAEERNQFYVLVNQMWLSEQIPVQRMEGLMQKYPKFSDYMKCRESSSG